MKDFLKEEENGDMVKVMEVNRDIPIDKKALKLAKKQYSATGVNLRVTRSKGKATLYREKLGEEKE